MNLDYWLHRYKRLSERIHPQKSTVWSDERSKMIIVETIIYTNIQCLIDRNKICATKRAVINGTTLNDPHVRENHRMINYPSLSNVIAAWGYISLIWSIESKRGSRKFHYMYTYIRHTRSSLFLWRYKKVKRMLQLNIN